MTEKIRIMMVENDAGMSNSFSEYLKKESFDCKIFTGGEDLLEKVTAYDPDLILLDLKLPAADLTRLCRDAHFHPRIPIIIVSADTAVDKKVNLLDLGADDYVVKPYDYKELTARIRAVLRRTGTPSSGPGIRRIVRCKDLTINLGNYTVTCRGVRFEMPPKEIELLYFLASSPDQVFTREQLLSRIWGYDYAGDTRTVDVHIKRIREKLGSTEDWAITTVWGVGYKFSTHPQGA